MFFNPIQRKGARYKFVKSVWKYAYTITVKSLIGQLVVHSKILSGTHSAIHLYPQFCITAVLTFGDTTHRVSNLPITKCGREHNAFSVKGRASWIKCVHIKSQAKPQFLCLGKYASYQRLAASWNLITHRWALYKVDISNKATNQYRELKLKHLTLILARYYT